MALTKVTSGGLTDDSIVNADINSSAAVALSKLATDPSNATNLASGTVPTARLGSGTASSSTVLYGDQTYKAEPGGGITEADRWYLTAAVTPATGDVTFTANWSRKGTQLGTGMTESSGIFTFPSTGYWLVSFQGSMQGQAASDYSGCHIRYSSNAGVAYASVSRGYQAFEASGEYGAVSCQAILDITDVSNDYVKFTSETESSTKFWGGADGSQNGLNFIRLGDT